MSIQQTLEVPKTKQSGFFTAGLALFSMFFGAGNLIFPLLIGRSEGGNVWYAISGLTITAVMVPFLGLIAMVLFQADYGRFFGRVGKVPGLMLLLLLQLILGPFGVIPRLVTLMHAMVSPYLGNISLMKFSMGAAILLFICSFKKQRLVAFLGAILTPVLLVALAALISLGLFKGAAPEPSHALPMASFLEGLLGGYNTMDLIASFLFATVVLPHFSKEAEGELPAIRQKRILKKMALSSLIAAFLLFVTYVGLCLVSARHAPGLDGACAPELMLNAIAIRLLGPVGGAVAALAVVTACLTTAMTLASIFSEYFRQEICQSKISSSLALSITLVVATLFANLGFRGIAAFLGPILQVVYPGLILLTVLNLFHALYGYRTVKVPVFVTFCFSGVFHFLPV